MKVLSNLVAVAIAVATIGLASAALAAGSAPYDKAKFDKAQAENQHIVVEVFKKGCPTCAAQQPGLNEARAKYPNAKFVVVDFMGEQAPVKRFEAVRQSTIIVYKGSKEVARLVGETNKDAIVAAIAKGA